jgi:hypothetical protein
VIFRSCREGAARTQVRWAAAWLLLVVAGSGCTSLNPTRKDAAGSDGTGGHATLPADGAQSDGGGDNSDAGADQPPRPDATVGDVTAGDAPVDATVDVPVDATGGDATGTDLDRDGAVDAVVLPIPAVVDFANGSRLKARYLQGDDGSRKFLGWFDTARNELCNFRVAEDGKTRCLPTFTAIPAVGAFIDAACTQAIAVQPQLCGGPAPLYVAQTVDAICSTAVAYYSLAALTGGALYSLSAAGVCSPSGALPAVYVVGPKVPATSFVEAVQTRDPSPARIQALYWQSTDGARQRFAWYDNTLATPCAIGLASDGNYRCLPSTSNVGVIRSIPSLEMAFSDGQCTVPSSITPLRTTDCPALTTYLYPTARVTTCPLGTRVYPGGSRSPAGTRTFRATNGQCVLLAAYDAYASFQRGEEIDPLTLAQVTMTQSGPGRLKAFTYSDGAGLQQPATPGLTMDGVYFDSTLGETCTFETAADGQVRCLPVTTTAVYTDTACTTPGAITPPPAFCTGETAHYVAVPDSPSAPDNGCKSNPYYSLGAVLGSIATYSQTPGLPCSLGLTASITAVGAAVPATQFVAGHEVTP